MKQLKQLAMSFVALTSLLCCSAFAAAYYPYVQTQIIVHNYSPYPAEIELVQMNQRFVVPGDTDYTAVSSEYFNSVDINVKHPLSHKVFAKGYLFNYGSVVIEDGDYYDNFEDCYDWGLYCAAGAKVKHAGKSKRDNYVLKVKFEQPKEEKSESK